MNLKYRRLRLRLSSSVIGQMPIGDHQIAIRPITLERKRSLNYSECTMFLFTCSRNSSEIRHKSADSDQQYEEVQHKHNLFLNFFSDAKNSVKHPKSLNLNFDGGNIQWITRTLVLYFVLQKRQFLQELAEKSAKFM